MGSWLFTKNGSTPTVTLSAADRSEYAGRQHIAQRHAAMHTTDPFLFVIVLFMALFMGIRIFYITIHDTRFTT
jgi:hypothetical protein